MDRLSILIFPAAPCDLHEFLKGISQELRDLRRGRNTLQDLVNKHPRADTPESRSSTTSSNRDRPGSPRLSTNSTGSPIASTDHDDWPMRLALPAKVDSLRGYFVCLSQALRYIHENDVRHKGCIAGGLIERKLTGVSRYKAREHLDRLLGLRRSDRLRHFKALSEERIACHQ